MYSDVFCKVYNEFGWNYYPEVFGSQLLQWLRRKDLAPRGAVDLACGTGALCRILAEQGIPVCGVDLAPGMIRIAKETNPGIDFYVGDMTIFRPEAPVDLVTCTGDALNHIPDPGALAKIFKNVYDYTNPGGWFVFDLLRQQEVSDSEPFEMDFDAHTRVWFQMTRPAPDRVALTVRVFEDGRFAFEECIRERIYDPERILEMLRQCGFREVHCDNRLVESANPGTTWFVTACH